MSVCAIAQLWIRDPATYGRYVERFMDVMTNYKGRVLVADERARGTAAKSWWFHFPTRHRSANGQVARISGNRQDPKARAKSVIVLMQGISGRGVADAK